MPMDESFAALVSQLQVGDDAAARRVWDRFVRRLVGLARNHLDARVRRKVDPEEVVQSVFRSFFLRQAEGKFELADWDGLWGLLALITVRKCGRVARHFRGPVHDVGKEVPRGTDSAPDWEAVAHEPTAEEALELSETLERLMQQLSDQDRRILELRLQEYKVSDIGEQIGRTEFTVEGRLKKIRNRLQAIIDADLEEAASP